MMQEEESPLTSTRYFFGSIRTAMGGQKICITSLWSWVTSFLESDGIISAKPAFCSWPLVIPRSVSLLVLFPFHAPLCTWWVWICGSVEGWDWFPLLVNVLNLRLGVMFLDNKCFCWNRGNWLLNGGQILILGVGSFDEVIQPRSQVC